MTVQAFEETTLHFDDLTTGDQYTTSARTVTEADIVNFAALSADYNSLHVDAEFAAQSPFGQRIAHGLLVLSIVSGLTTRLPFVVRMGPAIMGLLNLECRWKLPTFIGDTIHVLVTVSDLQMAADGGKGVVFLKRDAVNQRGEVVMESMWKLLVRRSSYDHR
jgi:acyl dehydratase